MRAFLGALVCTVVALAANAGLLHTQAGRALLTPEPPRVVQNFISALSADRPAIARNFVGDTGRAERSGERLEAFASELRSRHRDFRFDQAKEEWRQDDAATVRTTLRTQGGGRIEFTFELARDASTRLWKIVRMHV